MALIKRVQIANHLDSSQVPGRWSPDFRLMTFNLQGQNAAVVILNGGGKTTIANGILLLLTRHRGLARKVKAAMAPSAMAASAQSSYSHIRIEIVQPREETTGDMFVHHGMDVTGETWVYGVCGNKDGEGLLYYYYPGRLEDCPVGSIHSDKNISLYTNSEFSTKRSNVKGMKWAVTEDDYMRSLQPHFAAHATKRMLDFHLAGAGDKSAELYPVARRKGERDDEALFLNALAPELISGITGKESEDGEDSFEKTILISATKYVGAKIKSETRKKLLEGLRSSLDSAKPLRDTGSKMLATKQAWDTAKTEADFELLVLKKLVDENIIPGVPQCPDMDDESPLEPRQGIVATPDFDEILILDKTLASLIGSTVSKVNESALRKDIIAVPLHRMVGFTEIFRDPSKGGPVPKGYSQEDALHLLAKEGAYEFNRSMQQSLGVSLQESKNPTFFLVSDLNVKQPDSNTLENERKDLFSSEDTDAVADSYFHLCPFAMGSVDHKSKPEYPSLR